MRRLTTATRRARSLAGDDQVAMLAVISGGWFLSLGVRLVYPVLLPHIRNAYGLDLTVAGLLLSVLWFSYAIAQLPSGVLADRFGEGRIIVVSSLVSGGTLVLIVAGGSAPALFAATALLGFGTALYGVARFTILADLFGDRVGAATGITLAAGDAGNAILPPVASVLAVTVAWQAGFGVLIPLFALAALGCWAVLPTATSGPTSAVDTLSVSTARRLLSDLRSPAIVRGTAILFVGNAIWQAFTGFYPTYLVEVKGLTSTQAGVVFGGFFALGILVKPVAGTAFDRVGIRRSLSVLTATMTVSLAALPTVSGLGPVLVVSALASALLGYGAVVLTYVTMALPADARGTGLGAIRTSYSTMGAASPLLFGALADRGYFDEGFLLLAGLALVMTLLAVSAPEL